MSFSSAHDQFSLVWTKSNITIFFTKYLDIDIATILLGKLSQNEI